MNAIESERPDLAQQQQQQPVTSLPSRPPSGIVAGAALVEPAVPRMRSGADAVEAARASAEFSHPQSSSPGVTPTHAQLSPSSPTQPPLIPVLQPPSLQSASASRSPARPHPLTLPPSLASPWPLPVLRSSQLDASRLDLELASMLQEQLLSAFSLFPPGHVTDYEPELAALLRLLVFGLSVWRGQATPGSVLLNLRYRDERKAHPQGQGQAQGEWAGHAMQALGGLGGKTGVGGPGLSVAQRTALGLGMVLLPWVWARLGRWAAAHAAGGDSWGQPPAAAWRTWADPDDAATSPSSQDSPLYHTPQPASDPPAAAASIPSPLSHTSAHTWEPDEATLVGLARGSQGGLGEQGVTDLTATAAAAEGSGGGMGPGVAVGGAGVREPNRSLAARAWAAMALLAVWRGASRRQTPSRQGVTAAGAAAVGAGAAAAAGGAAAAGQLATGRGAVAGGAAGERGGGGREAGAGPRLTELPESHALVASDGSRLAPPTSHTSLAAGPQLPQPPLPPPPTPLQWPQQRPLSAGREGWQVHAGGGGGGGFVGWGLLPGSGWATLLGRAWGRLGGVWGCMQKVEAGYRLVALLNLLVFLAGGKYRSVLERIVRARLVYKQAIMTRVISFEYLNRQLVWQELSELLLFALPLLEALRARGIVGWLLPRLPDPRALLSSRGVLLNRRASPSQQAARGDVAVTESEAGPDTAAVGKELVTRPLGPCPICGAAQPLLPLLAVPCGDCFCYYCLSSRCAADKHYACPLDGVRVAAMERWRPPAVTQVLTSSTGATRAC